MLIVQLMLKQNNSNGQEDGNLSCLENEIIKEDNLSDVDSALDRIIIKL